MRHSIPRFAVLALLLPGACLSRGLAPSLIGDDVARDANAVGDAELIADVEALHNKRYRAGTGEFQAQLCVQQYVRARSGEAALAQSEDDQTQREARSEMLFGYGSCRETCRLAAEQMPSQYSSMAAKYQPLCAEGAAGSEKAINTDNLRRQVATLRDATQPLELFFADRDATELIEHLRQEQLATEEVEALATEVASLRTRNAAAIEQGRAFFEGPAAQANFQQRERNESRQASLEAEIERLQAEREEAKDAGLAQRANSLDIELTALRQQLAETLAEHLVLEAEYERMAEEAGVYTKS